MKWKEFAYWWLVFSLSQLVLPSLKFNFNEFFCLKNLVQIFWPIQIVFSTPVCVCWWPATPRLEINWKKFFIVKISLFCKGGGKNLFHSCCLSICMELYSEKTLHVSQMSHDQNMFVWHLNSIFLSSLWWSFYSLIWTFFFILGY